MLLPFTTLPPSDDRRFLYTYLGKRVVGVGAKKAVFQPLYMYDGVRSRPTFIVGGGESLLLNFALKDVSCGRTVIFIDGTGKREILDRLYYWCGYQSKKEVYALLPHQDELSHTWNPFLLRDVPVNTTVEFLLKAYRHFAGQKIYEDDFEFQSEVMTLLFRALYASEIVFHARDIVDLLSQKEAFEQLEGSLRSDSVEYYDELKHLREDEDDFEERLRPLTRFLKLFEGWTLSSYHPSINFNRLFSSHALVYAGLPIGWEDNDEKKLFCATGNLMIQHLKSLVSHMDMNDRENRRSVSLIINKAEVFLDEELIRWIESMRLSEVMVTCAFQSIDDFKRLGEKFIQQLGENTPNIAYFNSNDVDSASWFGDMWRSKRIQDGVEAGENSAWIEKLSHLNNRQYLFESHACAERPLLMTIPQLPDPPVRPDYRYSRRYYHLEEKPSFRTRYSRIEEERTAIA